MQNQCKDVMDLEVAQSNAPPSLISNYCWTSSIQQEPQEHQQERVFQNNDTNPPPHRLTVSSTDTTTSSKSVVQYATMQLNICVTLA